LNGSNSINTYSTDLELEKFKKKNNIKTNQEAVIFLLQKLARITTKGDGDANLP